MQSRTLFTDFVFNFANLAVSPKYSSSFRFPCSDALADDDRPLLVVLDDEEEYDLLSLIGFLSS